MFVFLLVSRECSRGKERLTLSSVVPHGWMRGPRGYIPHLVSLVESEHRVSRGVIKCETVVVSEKVFPAPEVCDHLWL